MRIENITKKLIDVVDERRSLLIERENNLKNNIFKLLDLFNCSTVRNVVDRVRVTLTDQGTIVCEVAFEGSRFYKADQLTKADSKELRKRMERINNEMDRNTFTQVRSYLIENQRNLKQLIIAVAVKGFTIRLNPESLNDIFI